MMDDRTAFFIGLAVGVVFILGIWGGTYVKNAGACEREHNVFRCEQIYIPVER